MTIAIDQLALGSTAIDTSATTVAFTTGVTVASGGHIVLGVGWFDLSSFTLSSVSGGGLTWTIDKQGVSVNANCAVVSAPAPAGLASGTTITATFSGSVSGARSIAGSSWTGVKTSSPVDGTPPALSAFSATTAWASNSATLAAGSLMVGAAQETTTNLTSTPTSPSIEMYDINGGAGSFSTTAAYRIEAAGGSFTVAGTWSGSATGLVLAVAYLAAAGTTPAAPAPRTFNAIPFMGGVL